MGFTDRLADVQGTWQWLICLLLFCVGLQFWPDWIYQNLISELHDSIQNMGFTAIVQTLWLGVQYSINRSAC